MDAQCWEIINAAADMDAACEGPPQYITATRTLEAVVGLSTATLRKQAEARLLAVAAAKRQKTEVKALLRAVYQDHAQRQTEHGARTTAFSSLPEPLTEQLMCGRFLADDAGLQLEEPVGSEGQAVRVRVCYQPIALTELYENIEDGTHRVRIAYMKGGQWRSVVVDRATIATRQSITALAQHGIDVTSENARYLVQYLADVEAQNAQRIPHHRSIERMGWIHDEFSPYVNALRFDGGDEFKDIFESVREQGRFEIWLEQAKAARARGGPIRMLLAAAFAAPIVGRLSGLTFLVHLWGPSGVGKTVGEMCAASVWGDPSAGRLVRSFNSTQVSLEYLVAFLCHLPLYVNELQCIKDKDGLDGMIYLLCEGQGKGRARRNGGVRAAGRWNTVAITNGEQPLTTHSSGAGAVNRVLSIECGEPIFDDPRAVADAVRANYGHAGKLFVRKLAEIDKEELLELYNEAVDTIRSGERGTDKQQLSAAYLLLADQLATEWIFQDGAQLGAWDFLSVMCDGAEVDNFARAYEWVQDWIASNRFRFDEGREETAVWGKTMPDGRIAIMGSILAQALRQEGFSYESFLADAERSGVIRRDQTGKRTVSTRINGVSTRCVQLEIRDRQQQMALGPDESNTT